MLLPENSSKMQISVKLHIFAAHSRFEGGIVSILFFTFAKLVLKLTHSTGGVTLRISALRVLFSSISLKIVYSISAISRAVSFSLGYFSFIVSSKIPVRSKIAMKTSTISIHPLRFFIILFTIFLLPNIPLQYLLLCLHILVVFF